MVEKVDWDFNVNWDSDFELASSDESEKSDKNLKQQINTDGDEKSENSNSKLDPCLNSSDSDLIHCNHCDFNYSKKLDKNDPGVDPAMSHQLSLHYDKHNNYVTSQCYLMTKNKIFCGICTKEITEEQTSENKLMKCSHPFCRVIHNGCQAYIFPKNCSNKYHKLCVEKYNEENKNKLNIKFRFTKKLVSTSEHRKKPKNRKYTESLTCPRFCCEVCVEKKEKNDKFLSPLEEAKFLQCFLCYRSYHEGCVQNSNNFNKIQKVANLIYVKFDLCLIGFMFI